MIFLTISLASYVRVLEYIHETRSFPVFAVH